MLYKIIISILKICFLIIIGNYVMVNLSDKNNNKKRHLMTNITKPTKKKYLNNKDMLEQIRKSHEKGEMTAEFAKMIMMLCHRYSQLGKYANYSYNEDMQAFAALTVVKVWKGFDPNKGSNPFAYFTQTIKHAFYQYLNAEKKQRDIRDELLLNNGDNPSFGFLDREDGDDNYYDNDYYNKLINNPSAESDTTPEEV